MRVKARKLVVTFATTSDALAMEAAAREHGLPGRSIPVPTAIDAGCGLAWCADEADGDALLCALSALGLSHGDVRHIELY